MACKRLTRQEFENLPPGTPSFNSESDCDNACIDCGCDMSACSWPPTRTNLGPVGSLISSIAKVSSNYGATLQLNYLFSSGAFSWKTGYPSKLQGCSYEWYVQDYIGPHNPCALSEEGTCRRIKLEYRLYLANCDGTLKNITTIALQTSPNSGWSTGEGFYRDSCVDYSDYANRAPCPCGDVCATPAPPFPAVGNLTCP